MNLENTPQPRHRRALASPRRGTVWAAALLVLLSVGSGAALAQDRRGGDRDGVHNHRQHDRYDDRGDRHDRRGKKVDRHRRDQRRNDSRYDRHRRHDRRHDHGRRYDRHDRYRHDHGRHYYDGRYRYHRHRHRSFSVPRVIHHNRLHTYRPYHHGRLYHREHHHYHQIYRFPVYTAFGVEYYPYAYCEGNFFGRGVFRDGRAFFDISISF